MLMEPERLLQWLEEILEHCPGVKVRDASFLLLSLLTRCSLVPAYTCWSVPSAFARHIVLMCFIALKCDLRDDQHVKERLQRYGTRPIQYEEGVTVARRIRASRYLGKVAISYSVILNLNTASRM